MDVQTILSKLEYFDGTFPEEALKEAIDNREAVVPGLLKAIRYTKKNYKRLAHDRTYIAHMTAMCLLAQFREKRALPVIIDFFSLPEKAIQDLTGFFIVKDLSSIFASVCDGNEGLLKSMIENKEVDMYVRAAGLESLVIPVAVGKKPRDEVIHYFKGLFNGGLEKAPPLVWNVLVELCNRLYPEEVYDEIKTAYEYDLVESFYIDIETIEETLKNGRQKTLDSLPEHREHRLFDDAIGYIGSWACYTELKDPKKKKASLLRSAQKKRKKIGRNAPCPCGSGRKYKKCCLN